MGPGAGGRAGREEGSTPWPAGCLPPAHPAMASLSLIASLPRLPLPTRPATPTTTTTTTTHPPTRQNDYGSEEAKRVGSELIEKERVVGLSESAQVGRGGQLDERGGGCGGGQWERAQVQSGEGAG